MEGGSWSTLMKDTRSRCGAADYSDWGCPDQSQRRPQATQFSAITPPSPWGETSPLFAQDLPLTFLRIPHGTESTHTLLPACMLRRSGMGRVFGWWPHHMAFGFLLSPTAEQTRTTGALQLVHKAGVRETLSCFHFLKSFLNLLFSPPRNIHKPQTLQTTHYYF